MSNPEHNLARAADAVADVTSALSRLRSALDAAGTETPAELAQALSNTEGQVRRLGTLSIRLLSIQTKTPCQN